YPKTMVIARVNQAHAILEISVDQCFCNKTMFDHSSNLKTQYETYKQNILSQYAILIRNNPNNQELLNRKNKLDMDINSIFSAFAESYNILLKFYKFFHPEIS